ncbi:MAG: helix-turn-helix transcriptional regulator [Ktedonobacteraceae bacterium]|nr:helix-turn-helix transcriptional regulator [Ktedonobacteraceae bacterium]
MDSPQTWRELLGLIIKDSYERQRVASAMSMHPLTLNRWVNNTSTPRPANLRRLLDVLPQHSERLLALIGKEFPRFSSESEQGAFRQPEALAIPSGFFTRVMHTAACLPKQLLFPLLGNLLLQQALEQLDPHRLGMEIIVTRCMPASPDGKIHSLREVLGKGNLPWKRDFERQGILLGVESLAGYAALSGHLQVNQKLREGGSLSAGYLGPWEQSAAAAPIMRTGEVPGSLLAISTQPDYFVPAQCMLLENYAELFTVAFAAQDFYPLECIELGIAPSHEVQYPYLSQFWPRVAGIMRENAKNGHSLSTLEAEQIVWRQIEEELLQLPFRGK